MVCVATADIRATTIIATTIDARSTPLVASFVGVVAFARQVAPLRPLGRRRRLGQAAPPTVAVSAKAFVK